MAEGPGTGRTAVYSLMQRVACKSMRYLVELDVPAPEKAVGLVAVRLLLSCSKSPTALTNRLVILTVPYCDVVR